VATSIPIVDGLLSRKRFTNPPIALAPFLLRTILSDASTGISTQSQTPRPNMERDLDNANPTILSVSQLPSRSRKGAAPRHGPDSKCDSIVYPKHHWPYGSSSSSDEGEDYSDEPMDEQDIYGACRPIRYRILVIHRLHYGETNTTWSGPHFVFFLTKIS
jgi:hypothetical protein